MLNKRHPHSRLYSDSINNIKLYSDKISDKKNYPHMEIYSENEQKDISDLMTQAMYELAVKDGFIGTFREWLKSLQGESPYIGPNGNWFIGDTDTGILASPDLSLYYHKANLIALTKEEILEICK